MNNDWAHKAFMQYCAAVAYVAVEDRECRPRIGSAFHVGEGVFITARHVVEGKKITEIGMSLGLRGFADEVAGGPYDPETERLYKMFCGPMLLSLESGPFFHVDKNIDLAGFVCGGLHQQAPWIPLGTHLDDWIGSRDFVLSNAIVMGYPPIPLTKKPYLVCANAEVNAVVDLATVSGVHFVLSAMPRGGFSGGAVYSEYGFLLGVVTQSLVKDHASEELGFFAAISVERIYECLDQNKKLPKAQEYEDP